MPTIKKNVWTHIKEYAIIILGLLFYTTGWTVFLMPNNLISGGVTGISSIIQYSTGGLVKAGYSYFVINAILLIVGFWILGRGFGGKTIFAVAFVSVALVFLPEWIPFEIIDTLALKNGKLMSVIMGGIMSASECPSLRAEAREEPISLHWFILNSAMFLRGVSFWSSMWSSSLRPSSSLLISRRRTGCS